MSSEWNNNKEIQLFQQYLQINTAQPDVDYAPCVRFLQRQATQLKLPINIYHPGHPEKPVIVITWEGTEPKLPTIVLNSHMDVVPAVDEFWTHPPFAAEIDEEGRIFARGTQDMKGMAIQYLLAVRQLREEGVKLKRTIHLLFVPDEEIGGVLGMQKFIPTDEFRAMNVGFSLDEGNASPTDIYPIFYGERAIWRIQMKITGTTGHGSLILQNTAHEKLQKIMEKYLEFRTKEYEKLQNNPTLVPGDVTTANLTILNGGDAPNVVPPIIEIVFDIRVAIDMSFYKMEKEISSWAAAGGDGVYVEYLEKEPKIEPTPVDDSNIYWLALRDAMITDLKLNIDTFIRPGATDSRHMRAIGIPSLGFAPMNHTPVLLHANNEFVGAKTFLDGIDIYKVIIKRLGNV